MSFLVNERGHALLLLNMPGPGDRPIVTVAGNSKWYGLYVVRYVCNLAFERGSVQVEEVPFPFSDTETPYVDHVPNPKVVAAWAEASGYALDERAHEMMIGRWILESRSDGEPLPYGS